MDLDPVPQGEPRPPDPGGLEGAPGDSGRGVAMDEGPVDREGAGAGVPQGTQESLDPDKWRWRPLSMTVLPGFTGETLIFPDQAIQLQVGCLAPCGPHLIQGYGGKPNVS